MQYDVTKAEKGKVSIKVDLPQAAFDEAYQSVLAEFGKDTKIAGFRPGMAPADVVEGHVGYNKILNEAASYLISKHISDILKKEELVPLDAPQISIDSLSKGSAFAFTAVFTLKPKVVVGNWKKLKVNKLKAKEITDIEVNESIKNIFDAWKKGQEAKGTEGPEAENKNVLYDAKGNPITLSTEGKNKVEVNKIDDEFAKKIGAKDLAHLCELIRKDLETLVKDQVETKLEQDLFEELAKTVEVEAPDVLIEDELNRILVRLNGQLEQAGKTLEDYLKEEKITVEQLKGKWREQAEKNVKISLAMDEIGKAEGVKVAKEEFDAAMAGVNQTNMSSDQKRDLENYVVFSIFQAKTLELVKNAAMGAIKAKEKPSEEKIAPVEKTEEKSPTGK